MERVSLMSLLSCELIACLLRPCPVSSKCLHCWTVFCHPSYRVLAGSLAEWLCYDFSFDAIPYERQCVTCWRPEVSGLAPPKSLC